MKLVFRFSFFSLILFLTGCSYGLVQHGKVNPALSQSIKERTVKERRLEFKKDLDIVYSKKENTQKVLKKMIERDLPPEEMDSLQKSFYAFGLLPSPDISIEEVTELYAEQAAGFYDPVTKKLYLTDWINKKDVLVALLEFMVQQDLTGEMLLSHELTHGLQDQHFDLEHYIKEVRSNLDAMVARHAVVEGDATIAGFNVVVGPFGKKAETTENLPERIQEEAERFGSGLDNLAPVIRESLIFPYYGGLRFCREVLLVHGWEGVNDLYRHPPESTEQIMHPEKYLKVIDSPKKLPKMKFNFLSKTGWPVIEENSFGELGTQIYLNQFISKDQARTGSEGWGNDRFWIAEKEYSDGIFATIWLTVWDSELDAQEFYRNCFNAYRQRYKKEGFYRAEFEKPETLISYGENRLFYMSRSGNLVLVADGFPEKETEKIAAEFKEK